MSRPVLLIPLLLVGILLDPLHLGGQAIPRTDVFKIAPRGGSVGALAFDGGFAVAWSIQGRLLDANGRLGPWLNPDSEDPFAYDSWATSPAVARESTGEFLFTWCSVLSVYRDEGDVWIQRFSPTGQPETPERQRLSEPGVNPRDPVVAAAGGRSVVAWFEDNRCPRPCPRDTTIKARVFAAGGTPVTDELLVDTLNEILTSVAVGVDAGGRFVILWWTGSYDCTLRGQRFSPDGALLGERFTLGTGVDISGECMLKVALSMTPDGSFAVAWKKQEDGGRLQRFRPQGVPESAPVDFSANVFSLAGDRFGNLALIRPEGIQLLNRQMVKQGPLVPFGTLESWFEPGVALGDRLLAAWMGPRKPGASPAVLGRIWDVRRDADACVYRDSRFLFDTAGDGGEPDVIIPFGAGQGQTPLLGDFNGDGRDDPCLYDGGRFLCDTAHDGGLAEKQSPRFGKPGDVPLLGDLDGDGRDDPCVRRDKSFLCDTDQNGKADPSITFGVRGDVVLMGDVDGDRRDDPCVVRGGLFLCDSAHNGNVAETKLNLSSALAGLPPGTPALGDVNGDGRDDPCVFTDGWLRCGLFPKGGRLPASILDLPFGESGDMFLLGDLDAF